MLLLALLLFSPFGAWSQQQAVKGIVKDEMGEPLTGVNARVKGTDRGAITDLDGNFQIPVVAAGEVIEFSFVGYITQEVKATSQMTVVLREDRRMLDDVIVVGYGVQKKSVVTAAIAKVDADALAMTSPVRVDNALKGLAAGVTVTSSSGQPGAAAQIRVRGVGSVNNSEPLYIVDGMPIEGGLDYLNPSDIASIEVLKDAASGAVYGARAANGVVLVTTKSGGKGRASVTYGFSYGWQSAWRRRAVLNATEYAVMMNEGRINAGMEPIYNDPYSFGKGTDWQDEVFNDNAPVLNHQVSISGGSDRGSYLLSAGYYDQEGIVGGNYGRSNYERVTLRANNNYTVFDDSKERSWLNSLKVTANVSYARIKSTGIATNSQWGSPLGSALALSPILSVFATGDQLATQRGIVGYSEMTDGSGNIYMVPGSSYNEMVNPIASLSLPGTKYWTHKVVSSFSAELQLWRGLKYRAGYGGDLSFYGGDGYTPIFYLSGNNRAIRSSVSSYSNRASVWQLENVLSYDDKIGAHSFSILLGQSAKKSSGWGLSGWASNLIDETGKRPYIDATYGGTSVPVELVRDENGEVTGYTVYTGANGGKGDDATLASLFARASYDYDERYMAQFTIRRDGSSRFGSNNHYAVFPSFSLGWNITNEPYLDLPEWLSNAKVRYSWGRNGNENIGNYRYTVLTATGYNYNFGKNVTMTSGVKSSGLANPDLKWEESEQHDVGIDLGFFDNRLTFSADYYKKRTEGMLMTMNVPYYVGETKPIGNVGTMENQGVELEAGYKWTVGGWTFNARGNLSYLKNELIEYGNDTGWGNLESFQGAGTVSRAQNGKPFPYFYGYKTDGIFQTMEEVNAHVNASGAKLQPKAVPGDVRFVDVNGDGAISDDDRTDIGKGMPDWSYGFNIDIAWKGFDLSVMGQGVWGCDIFDATRRTDISTANLPSYMLERWTGPGTSNKYPRFVLGDAVNWVSSDLYVYDGSYFRIKNLQLGYTLPTSLTRKALIQNLRFYVAAENLATFTRYHGFDPEIATTGDSGIGTSYGVDYGVYPQARTFTVGCNVTF